MKSKFNFSQEEFMQVVSSISSLPTRPSVCWTAHGNIEVIPSTGKMKNVRHTINRIKDNDPDSGLIKIIRERFERGIRTVKGVKIPTGRYMTINEAVAHLASEINT